MLNIATPWVYLLLSLPLLVRKWLPIAPALHGAALHTPFFHRIKHLPQKSLSFRWQYYGLRQIIVYVIWLLLITALSGPQWLGRPTAIPRTGRDLMLAIDLSGSMQTPDMTINGHPASRLNIVKQVASEFINQRVGDQLGLVVFGTHAYLQTPLTFDRTTVRDMLYDASIGLAGSQTAIGDAIGLAVKRLMRYPAQSRAVILLTDGGNNTGAVTPLAAAKLAKQEGIKIYTIGIGADSMTVPGLFGSQTINPSSDLDIEALQQIASLTGGVFYRAKDGNDLKNVYASINKLEPIKGHPQIMRPITPLYDWPLALALFLSLGLTWRYIWPRERVND